MSIRASSSSSRPALGSTEPTSTQPLSTGRGGITAVQALLIVPLLTGLTFDAACRRPAPTDRTRVSGQVEATEVQVAPPVGGRLLELRVAEGDAVAAGDLIARLDTSDADLALQRARAEREQAAAQLRVLQAGARAEDIRQAEAQVTTSRADVAAAETELAAAEEDLGRFEKLLASSSTPRKQRDDAATRRDLARERVEAARGRLRGVEENLKRLRAGAGRDEVAAASARVEAAAAQIAAIEKSRVDALVYAPVAGTVTEQLADVGELVQPRAPIVVLTDLIHAWANVYIDEPVVPRLRLGQPATVFTDASAEGFPGRLSFVSTKAEFTPRNVQTADERAKLVYRAKISLDNSRGVFKPGMPVEAEIPLQP